ncbi:MAG: hypothetical protein ACXW14_07940, partial [Burkholderiaceae bacterium]
HHLPFVQSDAQAKPLQGGGSHSLRQCTDKQVLEDYATNAFCRALKWPEPAVTLSGESHQ